MTSNYANSKFNFEDENTSWFKTFKLIPNNTTVLDVGCSSGNFGAELIKRKNCIVDGIEIDEADLEEAKKKLRNTFKIDVEKDNIDIKMKYDVIFFGDVVEHLAQPIEALKKIKTVMKNDSILVFSMPNITHMSVRLMLMGGEINYGRTGLLDETHLHFYNREEIYRVFNAAGFEITHFDYTINDIPYKLAEKELKKIGLTPTKEFDDILKTTNAVAYQFVGVAKKGLESKKQVLPKLSPHNIIEDYINEVKQQYEKTVNGLMSDREKIIQDRDRIIKDRDRIREERDKTKEELEKFNSYKHFMKTKLSMATEKLKRPRG